MPKGDAPALARAAGAPRRPKASRVRDAACSDGWTPPTAPRSSAICCSRSTTAMPSVFWRARRRASRGCSRCYGARAQIAAKVKLLVVARGRLRGEGRRGERRAGRGGGAQVFAEWPTPVVAVGARSARPCAFPSPSSTRGSRDRRRIRSRAAYRAIGGRRLRCTHDAPWRRSCCSASPNRRIPTVSAPRHHQRARRRAHPACSATRAERIVI